MTLGHKVGQVIEDAFEGKALRKEVDTTDGSVIYQAWAKRTSLTSEAVWRIKRTTINGSLITDEWAEGQLGYVHIYDDRASLNYS